MDFLLALNEKRRDDPSVDLAFVKALLIAVFGVNYIRANGEMNPDLVDFVKGTLH